VVFYKFILLRFTYIYRPSLPTLLPHQYIIMFGLLRLSPKRMIMLFVWRRNNYYIVCCVAFNDNVVARAMDKRDASAVVAVCHFDGPPDPIIPITIAAGALLEVFTLQTTDILTVPPQHFLNERQALQPDDAGSFDKMASSVSFFRESIVSCFTHSFVLPYKRSNG